ncbi:MAG: zf-HC2 domain-containing protein, partial [Desulfurivibrionaceae bacterium]
MQCIEVQPLFTDFADNTLSREKLHALTGHLLDCQSCAEEWREFQQTLNLVHGLEMQPPPADLLPGIQAKLAKRGILNRAWALVEALNFSLSIPSAAAIFTLAMLAGFLLKNSPLEHPALFPSRSARINALQQGEIATPKRLAIAPNAMFAVSHNGGGLQGGALTLLPRTPLATNLPPESHGHRLLSPDIHVLIENIGPENQIALCREML